jgi:hypothetical protein
MVTVLDSAADVMYYFACNKWLATNRDDGRIERILPASVTPPSERRNVQYQVLVSVLAHCITCIPSFVRAFPQEMLWHVLIEAWISEHIMIRRIRILLCLANDFLCSFCRSLCQHLM